MQNFLATQEIQWKFNSAKSPWWGGMYERPLKDVKKTLYKTLGKTNPAFEQLETVVMDIERYMNNRPLTNVESDSGEEQVLTPNLVMWGQGVYILEDIEVEDDELTRFHRRPHNAKQHAWTRWQREYLHSLMEIHRVKRLDVQPPQVGEIVLILGEEKNRRHWKKEKVIRIMRGADGVARGVILLHKGKLLERPIQSVCPLEIRSVEDKPKQSTNPKRTEPTRERRRAAVNAECCIRDMLKDDD